MKAEETNLNSLPLTTTTSIDTTTAPNVQPYVHSYHVVPPNSNIKLRMPLTNLTPEELAGAIISSRFKKYMLPLVTVNTIIWQNWELDFVKQLKPRVTSYSSTNGNRITTLNLAINNFSNLPQKEQGKRQAMAIDILEGNSAE